jgi:hypothetical protein
MRIGRTLPAVPACPVPCVPCHSRRGLVALCCCADGALQQFLRPRLSPSSLAQQSGKGPGKVLTHELHMAWNVVQRARHVASEPWHRCGVMCLSCACHVPVICGHVRSPPHSASSLLRPWLNLRRSSVNGLAASFAHRACRHTVTLERRRGDTQAFQASTGLGEPRDLSAHILRTSNSATVVWSTLPTPVLRPVLDDLVRRHLLLHHTWNLSR